MNRTTISLTSMAALILTAPIAFAQQSPDQKGNRAPSKSMENTAGGPERNQERGPDRGSAKSANDRPDREQSKAGRESADEQRKGAKESAAEQRKNAKDDDKPSKGQSAEDRMKSRGGQAERDDRNARGDSDNGGRSNSDSESPKKAEDATGKKTPQNAADRDPARNQDKDQTQSKDQAGEETTRKGSSNQARGEVREEDRQKAEQVRSKVDRQVRDRVRDAAFRSDVRRTDKTDIRIDIGVRLPRTIDVYELPPEIIEIAPAYRGYRYIVIGDDYCIVDPDTYAIVDVIPRTGGGRDEYAYRSGGGSARIELSNDQIEIIRRETRNRGKAYDFEGDLEVGIKLPGEYAFEPFPDAVVQEIPVVRNYRYVHVEDEIAIVAADQPDVVYVIED